MKETHLEWWHIRHAVSTVDAGVLDAAALIDMNF
jgi:hypothetical protein